MLLGSIGMSCQSQSELPLKEQNPPITAQNPTTTVHSDEPLTMPKTVHEQQVWHQATVKYFNLEGGFYGLITHDGQRLLPLKLVKEFRQEGAIVKVKGQFKRDVITTKQWGIPFEIEETILIKAGRVKVQSQ